MPAPACRGRRALRRGCDRWCVGHDHWACRPRSGGRYIRTDLYAFGSSPAYGCPRPTVRGSIDGCRVEACLHRPRSGRRYKRKGLCGRGSSRIATASVRTGFAMTWTGSAYTRAAERRPYGVYRNRLHAGGMIAAPTDVYSTRCVGADSIRPQFQNPCEAHHLCSLFIIHYSLFTT